MLRRTFLAAVASWCAIAGDLLSCRWQTVTEDELNSAIRNGWSDARSKGVAAFDRVTFLEDFKSKPAFRIYGLPRYAKAARFRSRKDALQNAFYLGQGAAKKLHDMCEHQRDQGSQSVHVTFRGHEYPTVELHGREIRAYHEFHVC